MLFCRFCGKELRDGVRFCSHCGRQIVQEISRVDANMAGLDNRINRVSFMHDPCVQDFVHWLLSIVDDSGRFEHQYYLKKANKYWQCDCLYDAFKQYWWPFDFYCPLFRKQVTGSSFKYSFEYLSLLAKPFRSAIQENNVDRTRTCAIAALSWGGVTIRNSDRIAALGDRVCKYFQDARTYLALSYTRLTGNNGVLMNSGFTKLYSLIVDDFIMYDGRVGAALGLLGRLYAEERGLPRIPEPIEFSYGSGRVSPSAQMQTDRRNPSNAVYQLPSFNGRANRQLHDNIKASWLLKSIADTTHSRFTQIPQTGLLNERVTAIQASLFMIGYDVVSL